MTHDDTDDPVSAGQTFLAICLSIVMWYAMACPFTAQISLGFWRTDWSSCTTWVWLFCGAMSVLAVAAVVEIMMEPSDGWD